MDKKSGEYRQVTAKVACQQMRRWSHCRWSLHLYRGCGHGCRYCFAISHQEPRPPVGAKVNIVELLERQLSAPDWQQETINMGAISDNYQPAEQEFALMPEVLRLLIRYRTPINLSTKSDLALRDYDLLAELAEVAGVNLSSSILTVDEALCAKLEPGAVSARRRFDMLRTFADTKVVTGMNFTPIIPLLTDRDEMLDDLYGAAKAAKVDYAISGMLVLRNRTRTLFERFVREEFPQLAEAFIDLYRTGEPDLAYKENLYDRVQAAKLRQGLTGHPPKSYKVRNTLQ